jgi:hypothetical protein
MSCTTCHDVTAHLESTLAPEEERAVVAHLDACPPCRAAADACEQLRTRLRAAASASPAPALEEAVMSAIASTTIGVPSARRSAWHTNTLVVRRPWRFALGATGFAALVLVMATVLLWEPSHAWSIEQSIEAVRPYHALQLTGTLGGKVRCRIWARSADSPSGSSRLLMRFDNGVLVWTDRNATHNYEPGSRVVPTDDAQTAGFNPWPGPQLFELARASGIRQVDTRWHFPRTRTVVTEWSFMGVNGPTSARAEFDLDTKLLVGIRQWENMDLRGVPAFEADEISYLSDLPDSAFEVDVPKDVTFRLKDVEVRESLLGLLSLGDAGMLAEGLPLEEAARRAVTKMWDALIARDLAALKRLSPIARDEQLSAVISSAIDGPDGAVAVVSVDAGVQRGHSALGPLTVVTSRVRHRSGGLYEEKFIVQHRLMGAVPSCVVAGPYGSAFRLE